MSMQRTGGMTAIGILNIIFGSLGTLLFLLMVLGGGLLAVGGAAMEAEMGADAEGMGAAAASGGGMLMLIGVIGAISWALLVVAGIGVLKCAPWGRTLSILCCGVIALMSVLNIVMGDIGIMTIGMLGYAGIQVALFFRGDWKAVFSGEMPTADMSSLMSASPIPGGTTAASAAPAPHAMDDSQSGHGDDDEMQSAA